MKKMLLVIDCECWYTDISCIDSAHSDNDELVPQLIRISFTLLITFYRYHEIFRLLFSPSDALSIRVQSTMKALHLMPNQYSSVHLRMKYPVPGINETDFSFQKHKSQITGWATNAVNCAAELHPNATIYVSSDNNDTVGYLLEESHFAQQQYTDATKHKKHPLVVKLAARDYSSENQHINFSPNREVDGFMSVFEDLFIMGLGKCVAHGVGGYGRLAAALSGGECVMEHRGGNGNPNVCLNALKNLKRDTSRRVHDNY